MRNDPATSWVVRGGWQGSVDDLTRFAQKIEDAVGGVVVELTTPNGKQVFQSADQFRDRVGDRVLAKTKLLAMSGQSTDLEILVRFARRPLEIDNRSVAGVAAQVWALNEGTQAAAVAVRDSIALELDLGNELFSSKPAKGETDSPYATAWRNATTERRFAAIVIAFAAVTVPLAIAALVHGQLEPGKSTLTDVLIWCGCNPLVLWSLPILVAGAFAYVSYAMPAVDIGDTPAWRRVLSPVTRATGGTYLLATIAKAAVG